MRLSSWLVPASGVLDLVGGTAGDAAIRPPKGSFGREAADSIMGRAQNGRPAFETGPLLAPPWRIRNTIVRCSRESIQESCRVSIRYANDLIITMKLPFCITMPRAELPIDAAAPGP